MSVSKVLTHQKVAAELGEDPAWDAAAVDRFNAAFDAGVKRVAPDMYALLNRLFRRDRRKYRHLRHAGHTAYCAMNRVIGKLPCACAVQTNKKGDSNV